MLNERFFEFSDILYMGLPLEAAVLPKADFPLSDGESAAFPAVPEHPAAALPLRLPNVDYSPSTH